MAPLKPDELGQNPDDYSLSPPLRRGGSIEQISPNPAIDNIKIRFPYNALPEKISLINAKGQTVRTVYPANTVNELQIPLEDFQPGLYIIKLQSNQGIESQKIIINK